MKIPLCLSMMALFAFESSLGQAVFVSQSIESAFPFALTYRARLSDLTVINNISPFARSMPQPWPVSFTDTALGQVVWKPFDTATIGVQVATGVGGTLTAGVVTVPLTYVLLSSIFGAKAFDPIPPSIIGGSVTAAVIAVPVGVYYGGKWMGGDGRFWWTALGGVLGGAIALSPTLLFPEPYASYVQQLNPYYLSFLMVVYIGGSIAGYHLSASSVTDSNRANTLSVRVGHRADNACGPTHHNLRIDLLTIHL